MKIVSYRGYELEKSLPNTSEDYFNRSEVEYEVNGQKKTFAVTYLRYFEERLASHEKNASFGNMIDFKEVFALGCLLSNEELQDQKRLYLGDEKAFEKYVHTLSDEKISAYIKVV